MGFLDALKKVKTNVEKTFETVKSKEAEAPAEEADANAAENDAEAQQPSGSGLSEMIKGGLSSALKAVGIGGWKAKQVEDLQPNFTSEEPLEHVLILNKAGAAMGAIKNLGVYADITKVTFSHALKVTTEDDFVEITTECREMPGQTLSSDDSSSNPSDFAFEDLLTRECPDLSGSRAPDSVLPYKA